MAGFPIGGGVEFVNPKSTTLRRGAPDPMTHFGGGVRSQADLWVPWGSGRQNGSGWGEPLLRADLVAEGEHLEGIAVQGMGMRCISHAADLDPDNDVADKSKGVKNKVTMLNVTMVWKMAPKTSPRALKARPEMFHMPQNANITTKCTDAQQHTTCMHNVCIRQAHK